MISYPAVNTLVRVGLGDDIPVLPSRIEDVDGSDVLLAAASYVGDLHGPQVGDTVSLHWTSARGVCSVPAQFLGTERRGMKLWRVRLEGTVELVQRRRYARVHTSGALSLVGGGDMDTVRMGWMVDLGEGGVRCRLAPGSFLPAEPVEVRLNVEGDVVTLLGSVVRSEPSGNGFDEVTISFPDDHPASDLVRRFVFQEQMRARRDAAERS
ncbi:PilZ domain-containing protein [Motilibacter rhizosphaerae]|uniref:PilZ domain-containing protein n=1 Tax=Motilibacter rhizosphaerae TaxID=598652 RepID=A0A4Q7NWC3_9ACTN|nr:PilZ domain-containing protein [Motilibacter rhizosphaerae]RZS91581.1 PilZ domain-containing protein [Motilibacter rhizosphaerae]